MSKTIAIIESIKDLAIELASIACPFFASGKAFLEWKNDIANAIFLDKLYNVLIDQDGDFNDWLKISERFDEDRKDYDRTVKQLIFTIDAINEVDLLPAYSNLLSAYKANLICKSDFFRLSFVLKNLLSEDAKYLSNNINKDDISEDINCATLANLGLMCVALGMGDLEGNNNNKYSVSELGKKLDKFALNYRSEIYSYDGRNEFVNSRRSSYINARPISITEIDAILNEVMNEDET